MQDRELLENQTVREMLISIAKERKMFNKEFTLEKEREIKFKITEKGLSRLVLRGKGEEGIDIRYMQWESCSFNLEFVADFLKETFSKPQSGEPYYFIKWEICPFTNEVKGLIRLTTHTNTESDRHLIGIDNAYKLYEDAKRVVEHQASLIQRVLKGDLE